jgi:hypothetical protein
LLYPQAFYNQKGATGSLTADDRRSRRIQDKLPRINAGFDPLLGRLRTRFLARFDGEAGTAAIQEDERAPLAAF